ncbi:hypothetical protein JCM10213_005379 [Rhodosporidiobolus nylandii]
MAFETPPAQDERALEARALVDEVEGAVVNGMERTGDGLTEDAMEAEALPPSPVGLLDLPDETLFGVYELLLSSHKKPLSLDHYEASPTGLVLPLPPVLVNRRIYSLAHPLRYSILTIAHQWPSSMPSFAHSLRRLDIVVREIPPELAPFLRACTSLTSFRLQVSHHIPKSVTDAMKGLRSLRELSAGAKSFDAEYPRYDGGEPDDPSFSIERDMPWLEKLTLDYINVPMGGWWLDNGVSNIRDFTLCATFPTGCAIPWTTASRLHLYPPKGYFRDPFLFVQKVAGATEPAAGFAIRDLIIEVQTVSPKKADPGEYYYEQVIPEMLELLQRTSSIKRLEFREFCEFQSWEGCETRLHTVQELSLQESAEWPARDAHRHIPAFLALFPSLTTFHLSGFDVLTLFTREAIATAASFPLRPSLPDPLDLVRDEPVLRVLLDVLQRSGVLDFRYRATSNSGGELRFRRETVAKDIEFEGEWWWL